MLVVDTKALEAAWTPVMGAEVLFAPIDRMMLKRARRAAIAAIGGEQPESNADPIDQLEELGDALSYQLIVAGAQDWRGVVRMRDADDEGPGEPLPFSREMLDAALSDPVTFDAFDTAYVVPFAMREREQAAPGKDSPLSPDTIGASETQEPITAGFPAPASAADVTSAPTASTRRKPRPKKPSGTS